MQRLETAQDFSKKDATSSSCSPSSVDSHAYVVLKPLFERAVKSIRAKGESGVGKTTVALEVLRMYGKGSLRFYASRRSKSPSSALGWRVLSSGYCSIFEAHNKMNDIAINAVRSATLSRQALAERSDFHVKIDEFERGLVFSTAKPPSELYNLQVRIRQGLPRVKLVSIV